MILPRSPMAIGRLIPASIRGVTKALILALFIHMPLLAQETCTADTFTPTCKTMIVTHGDFHDFSSGTFSAIEHSDHWYTDKYFWTGESVLGSSFTADYLSTAMYRGGTETNWLLGPHPSNRKLALVGASGFTFDSALYIWDWKLSHRDPSKAWRMIGRLGIPVGIAVIEGYAAAHNFETSRK